MIRDSLAIVVVCRRHPERLAETLASLRADSVPGIISVANLSGSGIRLSGETVIDGSPTMSLSAAVDAALSSSDAANVWILRDDTTVRPGAFAALAAILDTSPSVGIVGPKQMDADSPVIIREMGESMTRSGYALQLAERELDQAQYDRTSDVLAVGEAGMLVRREVWAALGGFDTELPGVDGALDFCFRARHAGWRVEVVPSAVIDTIDTSLSALAGDLSDAQVACEEARARAHRVLVYSSTVLRLFAAVALIVGAGTRGIGRFVRKTAAPFAELRGTMAGVANFRAIARSHRAFRAIRTTAIEGPRLFIPPSELRHRRALLRDEERAAQEAADDTPRLTFGATALWWTGFAAIAGLVASSPLLGATALGGGAVLPLPATGAENLAAIGATWSEVAGGIVGVPDGFASLVGILGSLSWWNPNAVIVTLVVLAIPLSFVAGYVGAGVITTHTRAATIVGGIWAVLPTLHIALGEGRIAAVLAHIALPMFARAVAGSGIVSLGWASILGAVVWVSVPALAPVIVLAVVVRAVTGKPSSLLTLLPAIAFEWPRLAVTLTNPVSYFADRGVPFPTSASHGFATLALWPAPVSIPFLDEGVSTLVALVVVAASVALTVIAVVVADNTRVGVLLLAAGTALLLWFAVGSTALASADGSAVGLFPGPLYDVVWFALVAGSAITITSVRFASAVLAPMSIAAVTLIGIGPISAVLAGTSLITPSTVRTLPAYVEAEAAANPGGGTLILTPTPDGIRVEVQRDAGVTLLDWTAAAATRSIPAPHEAALADIAANLIVESGFDITAALAEQGIHFVLLEAQPTATEVSAIASHSGLTSVGATDRGILWRVNEPASTAPISRAQDPVYLVILGLVGLVALIAAVPTSLPRRRPVVDDMLTVTEDDDEHS